MTGGRALTLIEVVVVLAVLGILFSLAPWLLRSPGEERAAEAYQATVQEARFESVSRNRPVAAVWDDAQQVVTVAEVDATAPSCTSDLTTISTFDVSEVAAVSVRTDLDEGGLLWFPSGRGQSCAGTSMASTTTFSSDSGQASVVMSDGGRIEVQ